jgi:hypothetical protein
MDVHGIGDERLIGRLCPTGSSPENYDETDG